MSRQLYISSKQLRGAKSVMYKGRCYKPIGTAPKFSKKLTDIAETQPFYKGCRPCSVGMITLSPFETSDPVSSTTIQLQLTGYDQQPNSYTLHLSTNQHQDNITFMVNGNNEVYMQGDQLLKLRNTIIKQINNGEYMFELVENKNNIIISVLKNTFYIKFTGLIWSDPQNPGGWSAPFRKLYVQVEDDTTQSSRYGLYVNNQLVDSNSTGKFTFNATGDGEIDEIWIQDDTNRKSNTLNVRTDNILTPYPIPHKGVYYTTTTNSYGWGVSNDLTSNITIENISKSIEQYGPKFKRIVRVQDFINDPTLWKNIQADRLAGRVVSNWNGVTEKYSNTGKSYMLTNNPTGISEQIYDQQAGVIDCSSTNIRCSGLNGYFLTATQTNKSAVVSFTMQ